MVGKQLIDSILEKAARKGTVISDLDATFLVYGIHDLRAELADKHATIEKMAENAVFDAGRLTTAYRLIKYAAENSTVTTSDDPGCFFCDRPEGDHADGCEAAAWLSAPQKTRPAVDADEQVAHLTHS